MFCLLQKKNDLKENPINILFVATKKFDIKTLINVLLIVIKILI
jgi:hypothetical protein